jgi:hypothetical protein
MESLSIAARGRDEIFALDPFSRTVRRYVPKNSAA